MWIWNFEYIGKLAYHVNTYYIKETKNWMLWRAKKLIRILSKRAKNVHLNVQIICKGCKYHSFAGTLHDFFWAHQWLLTSSGFLENARSGSRTTPHWGTLVPEHSEETKLFLGGGGAGIVCDQWLPPPKKKKKKKEEALFARRLGVFRHLCRGQFPTG